MGVYYRASRKAWMTEEIFFWWLAKFDAHIGQTTGRQVLLLLVNASCHGVAGDLPQLSNVRVMFLPANNTSLLQPLDAGVVASVKMQYRKRVIARAVDLLENDITLGLHDVD